MHRTFEELTKRVEELSKDELDRANKWFPLFHSRHEGYAVLSEEVWESNIELKSLYYYYANLKVAVFTDIESDTMKSDVKGLMKSAIRGAAELIQVAAMCQKMIDSEGSHDE